MIKFRFFPPLLGKTFKFVPDRHAVGSRIDSARSYDRPQSLVWILTCTTICPYLLSQEMRGRQVSITRGPVVDQVPAKASVRRAGRPTRPERSGGAPSPDLAEK